MHRDFVGRFAVLVALMFATSRASGNGGSRASAASADQWITINKDYSSQRYVDLDQISTGNVQNVSEVCEARLNEPSWFSSGLLMVGRTLFASTLRATYAVDAATCAVRWRSVIRLHALANISSRGPGYLDGRLFRGTADGRVLALDGATGKVLWDVQEANPKANESFVAAPSPGGARYLSESRSAT
jgi:glucose dehydrogenase